MDVVKFMKECKRMCESFENCASCPLLTEDCDNVRSSEFAKAVSIVEEWSAAHPRKTRQSVFLEQYPEAYVDKDGLLQLCPTRIVASYRLKNSGGCAILGSNCKDCRKAFWTEEV